MSESIHHNPIWRRDGRIIKASIRKNRFGEGSF